MQEDKGRMREGSAAVEDADTRHERRDAAENRRRVLDAAQRLFAEQGVEAVSMHQIAQASGVGQGTLYRRYAHKGDLCRDLMHDSADRWRADIEAYLAETGDIAPPMERLGGVLFRMVSFLEEKLTLLASIGDSSFGKRRVDKYRAPLYQWMHGMIATLLEEAIARGELRPLDTTYTADALLAALSPDIYQFQREQRGLTPDQILRCVCSTFAADSRTCGEI